MKGTSGGGGVVRNQEGSPVNSLYGLKCLGMVRTQDQADALGRIGYKQYNSIVKPGDLLYADLSGPEGKPDGIIDDNDKTIIGSTIPRYTYGLTLNFGWKGLGLSAQFQGVGKADAYIDGYYTQPGVKGGTYRKEHLDRWTPDTPDGKFPRMSNKNTNNLQNSSFWMSDASYLRLKNLQLSYALPQNVVKKIKLKGLMFFANATNLFTLTDFYDGYDPESVYSSGDSISTGASGYPLVSTYTLGLEVKF